jgi:hypothetical protein
MTVLDYCSRGPDKGSVLWRRCEGQRALTVLTALIICSATPPAPL